MSFLLYLVRLFIQAVHGRLGIAAAQGWIGRNATDWRTPCRKCLATPLHAICDYTGECL